MPANNTNTRNIIYVGDDPEERKYINHWDSVVFDYFFEGDDPYKEDDAECKFLKPSCGIGYCIYRNVKDVYVKVPTVPYDGDTFAVMDITSINDQYVRDVYWSNRQLIKENPLSDDIDITLNTAVIYIDNTYDFPCNTKVIYNGVTYKSGDIFPLENTCEFIHQFIYDKGINAWVVVKIDKECQADVDVEVRYWDFCIPRVYREYGYEEPSISQGHGDVDSFNYIMRGIDSNGNKVMNKKWNYLPFFWTKVENDAYQYIGVNEYNDYMLQLQATSRVEYNYWQWDNSLGQYILATDYYYTYPEGYRLELTNTEYYKASKGGRFRFGFFPKFNNSSNPYSSSFNYNQTYEFFQDDSIEQFYTDWSMYFTIYNVVDGVVVPNSEIFPKITSFVEKTSDPYTSANRNDIALFSAWFAVETLPWNTNVIHNSFYDYSYSEPEYVFNERTNSWELVSTSNPPLRNLNVNGISNRQTDLGNYRFTPISDIVLAKNYDNNINLSNFSNLSPYVMDLSALISGYGWKDGEVKEVLLSNIMSNFYGEKWQEILKLTGMIYLNYLVPDYESNMAIVKYICDEIKNKKYYDYVYTCPPWAIGNGETGDVADLSALSPIKGNNVSYARSQYIWHMNEPILVDIDREEHWFKLPFYFNVNLSPNVDKIYGKLIESVDGIVSDKSKYSGSSFSMKYYLITEALHFWELWGYMAGKEKIIPSPTDVQQYIFYDDPRDAFYYSHSLNGYHPSTKHTFEKLYGDDRDWGFYYFTTDLREAEIKPSFYYLQDVYQEKRFPVTYRITADNTGESYTKWKGLPQEKTWWETFSHTIVNNPDIIKKIKMNNSEEDISDNFFFQRWYASATWEVTNKYSTLYDRRWALSDMGADDNLLFYDTFDKITELTPGEHASNLVFILEQWNKGINTYTMDNIFSMSTSDIYLVFDTRNDMEFFRFFRMDILTTSEDYRYGVSDSVKRYLYPSHKIDQYSSSNYLLDSWSQDLIYDMYLHAGNPDGTLYRFSPSCKTTLNGLTVYPKATNEHPYPETGEPDWKWNTFSYHNVGSMSSFTSLSVFNKLVDYYPDRITNKEEFVNWIKSYGGYSWRLWQRKKTDTNVYKTLYRITYRPKYTTRYWVQYPTGGSVLCTSQSDANSYANRYNNEHPNGKKATITVLKRDTWQASRELDASYSTDVLKLLNNTGLSSTDVLSSASFQFKDEYLQKGNNATRYSVYTLNNYISILNKESNGAQTLMQLFKKLHKADSWPKDLPYTKYQCLFNQEWAFMLKDIYPDFAMDYGTFTTQVKMSFSTPDFYLYLHIQYITFGIYKFPLKVEFSEFSYPSIKIYYDDLEIVQDRPNVITQDYREGYSLFEPQTYNTYAFKENWWNYNEDALLRDEFKPYVQQYGEKTVKDLIVKSRLQPSTTDDNLVYSAVFHQPIPTTNQRINDILLLFNSLTVAHDINNSGSMNRAMDIAYTLYPGDLRYYTMYERARYNDGVWNYYDYQTTQVFERKWISTDTTKYPPTESLKTFSVDIPDYKYIEYQKDILDKHLPRVRTKNPKDWIFIKRYGVKHYIRKITSASANTLASLSGLHEMYRFLPANSPWTVSEENLREHYYKNTSDPTPILSQFEPIDYYVQNDVYVLYNKNKYNHTMNFILKTFDMKRLYSIGNYRDINWTRYYHNGWVSSWSASSIEKENQYIDGKGQKVSSFKTNMPLKHLAAALYYLCAYGETVLSPQHNFYEMYASGAYHALLPNSDYSFGDYFEHSYNEYDAATIEYIFTEPAIQSQHAYYTIDVVFYLNAIYKYDNQRRFPVEIHRKRFFYTKDNHDYRYRNSSGYMRLNKQYRENELFNIIDQFDLSKTPTYSGPYYEGTDAYINAASIYPERSITEIDYPTKDGIVTTGYRITYRITRLNGSFTDSTILVVSHSNTKNLFDRDIAGTCRKAEEVWGDGYRNINEDAFTDLEVYNTKQNNNEMDRRITKIEFFDMVDYNQYKKNGASNDNAATASVFLTMNISNKTSPTTASKTFNDDVHGYGTLTCKLDPTTSKHHLMFYWKQTKPALLKAYVFHRRRIKKYPDIPTNVPYYTTLLADIVMYYDYATKPLFDNANTLASINNYAFRIKNTEKGGILIRYENLETAKWVLDKISPEAYDWIVQEFETQKAAQEQRLAEIQYILDTDDEARANGQALLTSSERKDFLAEKTTVTQSLFTTREQFYGSNCYLRIDIQISSPFISGQTHPNYKPDFGGIKIEFFSDEYSPSTGLTDNYNTFSRTIVELENINWNIFFEGQQYDLWDIPRLVRGGLVKSTHRTTKEILYTLFPYEYKEGTIEEESSESDRNKTFEEFLKMNVEICDVDPERIPHGIICTRTKETDVFVRKEGYGSNLTKHNRYSNVYLQTRKPLKPTQYQVRESADLNSLAGWKDMDYRYVEYYRRNKVYLYLQQSDQGSITEGDDYVVGSEKDITGATQGRTANTAYQLKGGDDIWYKHDPSRQVNKLKPQNAFLGNDYIDGGTGNDVLSTAIGKGTHDTLIGGRGNDTLIGHKSDSTSSRTYIINKGDGHDIIYNAGTNDVIKFGAGITPQTVYFSKNQYGETLLTVIDDSQTIALIGCDFPITLRFSDGYEKKVYNNTRSDDDISMNHKIPECFDLYLGNFIISKRFNLPNNGYKIVNDIYQDDVGMLFNVHDTITQTLTYPALILEFNKMVKQIDGPNWQYYQVISRYAEACGPIYLNEDVYAKFAERTLDFKGRTYLGNDTWRFPVIDKAKMTPDDWDPTYRETLESIHDRIRPHNTVEYSSYTTTNDHVFGMTKNIKETLERGAEYTYKYETPDAEEYIVELNRQLNNEEKNGETQTDTLEFYQGVQPEVFITETDGLYPSGTIVFYNDYELDSPENIAKMKFRRPVAVVGRVKCNIYIENAEEKKPVHNISRQNISFYLNQDDLQRILGWKDTKGTDGPHYEPKYEVDFRFWSIKSLLKAYMSESFGSITSNGEPSVYETRIWERILRDTQLFYTTKTYRDNKEKIQTNNYSYFGFNEYLKERLTNEMKALYNDNKHTHCREEWNEFLAGLQLLDQEVLRIEAIMDDDTLVHPSGLFQNLIYDHVRDNILPIFPVLFNLCEYLAVYGPTTEMIETDQSEDERMPRWLDVALEKGAIDLFEHAYLYNLLAKTFHPYKHFYYDIVVEPISYEYGNVTSTHITTGLATELLSEWYMGTCQDEVIKNHLYLDASSHGDDWRWKCDLDAIPLNGNPTDEEMKLVIRAKENLDDDNDPVYRSYLLQNSYNEWHFPTDYDLYETLRDRKYYGALGTKEYFQEEDPVTLPEEYRRETEIFGDRYYTMEEKNKNFVEITPEKWYDTKKFIRWINNGEKTGYKFWFKEPKFMEKIQTAQNKVLVRYEDVYNEETGNWEKRPVYETGPKYKLENGMVMSEDGITIKEISDPDGKGGGEMYETDKRTQVTDTFTVKGDRTIVNIVRVKACEAYDPYMSEEPR